MSHCSLRRRVQAVAYIPICLSLVSNHSLAEAQSSVTLPEISVTASLTPVASATAGSSLSRLTEADIHRRQNTLISDLMRDIPGVAVNRSGVTGGFTQLRIRGAEANHTLVLIDGIEANNVALDSEFDFANLLPQDVESIEVLRGPQSALWGSDALGGVVNITTKRGRGNPSATVAVEGGTFNTHRINADFSGGTDRGHFSLSGNRLDTEGESVSPTGNEEDGYDNTTISFKGGFDASDTLILDFAGRHVASDSEGDPQDFTPGSTTFGQVIDGKVDTELDQTFARGTATLLTFGGDWEHIFSAAVSDTDSEFVSNSERSSSDGKKTKYAYQSNYYFNTNESIGHTLTFLAEREDEEFDNRGLTADDPRNQSQEITNNGVVLEYRLELYQQTHLSAAVRHDDNDRFEDETTGRLTASHLLTLNSRVHASYGTGIKNPGFVDLFGFFPGTFRGNPELEAEKSTGWDIGVEQEFLQSRGVVDITYFDADLEDEIITNFVFDPSSGAFVSTPSNLSGESDRKGIEVFGRYSINDALTVTGSLTLTDSEDPNGVEEIRRPEMTASVNLNYSFLGERANLNFGIDHNGSQDDLRFLDGPPFSETVELDSFTLANLSGSYQVNDRFRIFGRVENLFDEDYQEIFGFDNLGRAIYFGGQATF